MPINLEELLAQPDPEYTSVEPGFELIYPLSTTNAFKTVNAAVFYTFARLCPTQRVERDEVDGGVAYHFRYEDTVFQLFVLHISDTVASLRLHRCELVKEALLWRDYAWQPRDPSGKVQRGMAALLASIDEAIVDSLRCASRLDIHQPPPHPPASELFHVFTWQRIYHPDMPDKELAELIGVSHQTVRNARSRYQQTKRSSQNATGGAKPPRGKK